MLHLIRAKHNLVFKLVLLLAVAFFLALVFPDINKLYFRELLDGKPWQGFDLIATEDIIINKTDNKETNLLGDDTIVSLYKYNPEIAQKELDSLALIKDKDSLLFQFLKKNLTEIYEVGIISRDSSKNTFLFVYDKNGNLLKKKYVDFYNLQQAYDTLLQRIRRNKCLEKIQNLRVHPENYLAVNYEKELNGEDFLRKREYYTKPQLVLLAKAGDTLVKQGFLPDSQAIETLTKYFETKKNKINSFYEYFQALTLSLVLLSSLFLYLYFFRKPVFGQNKQVFFLLSTLLYTGTGTYLLHESNVSLFYFPYILIPVVVRVFFDNRTALFTFLINILYASFFTINGFFFLFIQLMVGIGLLFSLSSIRKRQDLSKAALLVTMYFIFLFALLKFIFNGEQALFLVENYIPFILCGVMIFLAYPFIQLTEKFFGFVSDFSYLELCDINQPLLRELSQRVPGTFQHSLQVANLAEEAAYFIGANTLLVRAGALYHDIGKMYNPEYFIENQSSEYSPHNLMRARESAQIILQHVIRGIELAREHKLPEQIIDFIRTHHGTTTVHYFLKRSLMEGDALKTSEEDFKYPGPIPFNKETAILMLADGVEAASRSLPKKDAFSISKLVDEVIDYKINQNQLINSDITFKDIALIRKIFKKRLMNIYHARIEYPY